ncbi:MAG TPA: dsRBD fold-containing protein [Kineosporiaceae bacterium]|nr:dsRBD fold-containing protein [Kineosporiaceae bacterium]
MDKVAQWTVTIDIDEHDGHTRAVARLHTLDTERMVGVASRPRPYPGEQPRTNANGVRMVVKTGSVALMWNGRLERSLGGSAERSPPCTPRTTDTRASACGGDPGRSTVTGRLLGQSWLAAGATIRRQQ